MSAHTNESCHAYESIMSHIWISHVTHIEMSHVRHMNQSCHTYEESCHTHECVFTHIEESYYSCEWFVSLTQEWLMSNTWSSHVIPMNQSCHTSESHTWMHSLGCALRFSPGPRDREQNCEILKYKSWAIILCQNQYCKFAQSCRNSQGNAESRW